MRERQPGNHSSLRRIPFVKESGALPVDKLTDEALMLEIREGQVGKLAVLFERHHRQLFSFFLPADQ